MLNRLAAPSMLAAAGVVLLNWTQLGSDALWFYINFLIIAACALGALALWRRAHSAGKMLARLLAVLAAAVAFQVAFVEPLFAPLSLLIWEVINFTLVIALPLGAGLLLRRS